MPPLDDHAPAFRNDPGRATARVMTLLLAGGQGSRLHELTARVCKPAVHFAGAGRIVDFAMANAFDAGLTRMMVATQYRPEALGRHLGLAWAPLFARTGRLVLRDGAAVAGDEGYLGTADAVTRNLAAIDAAGTDHLVVLAADHVYRTDLGAMLAHHRASGARVTVAAQRVPLAEAPGFGIFALGAGGRARGFAEKPANPQPTPEDAGMALASMGIYVFDWAWLRQRLMEDMTDPASRHDFGHDILPPAVAQGLVQVWQMPGEAGGRPGYWRDVGTLDSYRRTQLDFATPRTPCALPGPMQLLGTARLAPREGIVESVVLPGARIGAGVRLERCIIAAGAELPAGLVIGADAEEDARWFRRSAEGTVLVTPKMLARRATAMAAARPVRANLGPAPQALGPAPQALGSAPQALAIPRSPER